MKTVFQEFNKVTVDDLLRVANKIFKKDKLNLAIVDSSLNKNKLENIFLLNNKK